MCKEADLKLFELCTSDTLNMTEIETLLKSGANPLGAILGERGVNNLYIELVDYYYKNNNCMYRLPVITELFLRYDMDISKPELPYNEPYILHPLYYYGSYDRTGSDMQALKMLFNTGLTDDASECYWRIHFEIYNTISGIDSIYDREMLKALIMKLLLIASYPHILNSEYYLQNMIQLADNDYDVTKFRNYTNYAVDLISPIKRWRIYGVVANVFSLDEGKVVWRIKF